MTSNRTILVASLLVLGLLGWIAWPAIPWAADSAAPPETVAAGETETALFASGTIQAHEVRVASQTGGRIQALSVNAGDAVSEGQLLVTLDATPLLIQISLAEAAVETARADLAQVQAGPRPETIAAARAALALAKAQRDGEQAAAENATLALENPQELDAEIAQARTQLELAEQAVELAEAELAQQTMLRDIKEGLERQAADLQVRAGEEKLAAAKSDQQAAQTLLNWLWAIRNEPLHLQAQANLAAGQVEIAEAGVVVAQAQLQDLLDGPSTEEVAVVEAALRRAEADLNVLQVQLVQYELNSPIDGMVLSRSLHPGELAAPAATILTLADLSEVTLQVYVPENRIGEVQLGQSVAVTVDSFPGQAFAGKVYHIANEPEFTPRNVVTAEERENTFYAVDVRLPNPDLLLKVGMPADAEFR